MSDTEHIKEPRSPITGPEPNQAKSPAEIEFERKSHIQKLAAVASALGNGIPKNQTLEGALGRYGLSTPNDINLARILFYDLDGTTLLPREERELIRRALEAIKDNPDLRIDPATDTPRAIVGIVYNVRDKISIQDQIHNG